MIALVVSAGVILFLLRFVIPAERTTRCTWQMHDLNDARNIYLGLYTWANDHNGKFPTTRTDGTNATNANEIFANLIPDYVPSKHVFWIAQSGWCNTKPPDEKLGPKPSLSAGENHFANITNLSPSSNPQLPLIVDAPTDQLGRYLSGRTVPGALWKGRQAVIVRVDGSARIEEVDPITHQVMAPINGRLQNIFTRHPVTTGKLQAGTWLSGSNRLLLPIPPRR